MYIVHVVMAAAAALLAVVALTAVRARRDQRLVTAVACGALVVGHLASLLAAAPQWYALVVVFASIAGFGWVTWTLSAALAGRTARSSAAGAETAGADTRPALRVVNATIVEPRVPELPAAPARNVVSIVRDEPVRHVTREQILAAGPLGAEHTTGPTYVAANLVDYVEPGSGSSIAQTHRRTAARSGYTAPTRTASPEQRLRALQVRAAYATHGSARASRDLRA